MEKPTWGNTMKVRSGIFISTVVICLLAITDLFYNSRPGERTCLSAALARLQPSLMENIGRSLVAVRRNSTEIYVGWRLLGTDSSDVAFDLYRSTGGAEPVKLDASPISATTDFVDTSADLTLSNAYTVRPVVNGSEVGQSNSFTVPANAAVQQYLSVPIQRPTGGTSQQAPGNTVGQSAYTYSANDASVGDLDGDGQYEIILKWDPSNSRDNASAGLSGPVVIDAYRLDGTRLWRIDLGKNIRSVRIIRSSWSTIWTVTARPRSFAKRRTDLLMVLGMLSVTQAKTALFDDSFGLRPARTNDLRSKIWQDPCRARVSDGFQWPDGHRNGISALRAEHATRSMDGAGSAAMVIMTARATAQTGSSRRSLIWTACGPAS